MLGLKNFNVTLSKFGWLQKMILYPQSQILKCYFISLRMFLAESVSVSPVAKYHYTTAIPWLATRRPPLRCVLGWACGEAKTLDSCLEKKAGRLFRATAVIGTGVVTLA